MSQFLTLFAALFIMPFVVAHAMDTPSLKEQLDAKQAAFTAKAEPQKVKDFNDGVEAVAASGVLERAKNSGDVAPDFTLPDASGEDVRLSALLEKGPVVMVWYRGEWCPYCNIQLADIQKHYGEFEAANAQVVAISPETPDRALMAQGKLDLDFYVLSDVGSKVAENYGVAYTLPEKIAGYLQEAFDIHTANDDDRNLLPLAAAYVIGQDGKIAYAYLDADYRKRAETSELLEEVQKLKK